MPRRGAWLLLTLGALTAAAGPVKKRGKKAPPAPASAQVKAALDAAQPEVSACVLDAAGDTSTWTQVVAVRVVLNGVGQVLEASAHLAPEGPSAAALKTCVEAALRRVTWPAPRAPLTTAEREWTFSMQ